MKEIQKKDLPEISGGAESPIAIIGPPCIPLPYPQMPGGPIDPNDPLGDGTSQKHVNL